MNWFTDFLFGKRGPEKYPQANQPHRTSRAQREAKQVRSTLLYARQQRDELLIHKARQDRWEQKQNNTNLSALRRMTGAEFEDYLAGLFRVMGYEVEQTPASGDYGADLIASMGKEVIAVQAKCYAGSVGVAAVQEALSGMAYYRCTSAWVVTTGYYTPNARELAEKSGVKLVDSSGLTELMTASRRRGK